MGKYRCKCGFEGHCYGIPTTQGVSAPWCPECQMNNGLTPIKEEPVNKAVIVHLTEDQFKLVKQILLEEIKTLLMRDKHYNSPSKVKETQDLLRTICNARNVVTGE